MFTSRKRVLQEDEEPDDYVYLRVTPIEIRAWREANELAGRLLMRDGKWLPLDG